MTLLQPLQICVAPHRRRPRCDVSQILPEVKILQSVVEELANVPGQVVVTVDEGHLLEEASGEFETLLEGCPRADLEGDGHAHTCCRRQQEDGYYDPPVACRKIDFCE